MKPMIQRKAGPTNANYTDGNSGTLSQSSLRTGRFPGWALAPLRLFLGITFVYAGIQKLTDPQFFHPTAAGYIGRQITAFAHGSPIHDLLINVALPHATLFGLLIAYGEIAIGLGALLGLLFRAAALFGMILSILFFLSASWHVYPYFYGADIVFTFCWLTLLLTGPLYTALPSVDAWLLQTLIEDDTIQRPGIVFSCLAAFFGGSGTVEAATSAPGNDPYIQNQPPLRRNVRGFVQKKKQTRRSFLAGMLTGTVGALGIAVVGFVLRSLGNGGDESANVPATNQATAGTAPTSTDQSGTRSSSNATPGTSSSSSSNATPGASSSSNVIAKTGDVAKNNAVTFTIPSSGDPGVLIHLSNDQFVAYDATCTHAGCQVDYDPGSQNLVCPCHGATFDPKHAAAVLDGPANTPLTAVPIHVDATTGAIVLQ